MLVARMFAARREAICGDDVRFPDANTVRSICVQTQTPICAKKRVCTKPKTRRKISLNASRSIDINQSRPIIDQDSVWYIGGRVHKIIRRKYHFVFQPIKMQRVYPGKSTMKVVNMIKYHIFYEDSKGWVTSIP